MRFIGCFLATTLVMSWIYAENPTHVVKRNKEITIELSDRVRMTFVRIEPGEFTMGAPDSDRFAPPDTKPQRRVKVTRTFYLGKWEVTRGEFALFVNETGFRTRDEKDSSPANWRKPGLGPSYQTDEHPVVVIDWQDAKAFCDWLAKHPKAKAAGIRVARLPSEAEWEYACRGGTTTRWSTGDEGNSLKGYANVQDVSRRRNNRFAEGNAPWDDGYPFTAPVGRFKPNQFGLYDMHGNVWEWCEDFYGPLKDMPTTDPVRIQPNSKYKLYHVVRGGGWDSSIEMCKSSVRTVGFPAPDVGFRVLVQTE